MDNFNSEKARGSGVAHQLENLACKISILEKELAIQREEAAHRAAVAHKLIAENMLSVVRLEIANVTDQIINNALAIKRDVTGSGNAEFSINIAATLVMLAGNVLSAGSMGMLGRLLVAGSEALQAGAENDPFKLAGAIGNVTTDGVGGALMTGLNEVGSLGMKRFASSGDKPVGRRDAQWTETGETPEQWRRRTQLYGVSGKFGNNVTVSIKKKVR